MGKVCVCVPVRPRSLKTPALPFFWLRDNVITVSFATCAVKGPARSYLPAIAEFNPHVRWIRCLGCFPVSSGLACAFATHRNHSLINTVFDHTLLALAKCDRVRVLSGFTDHEGRCQWWQHNALPRRSTRVARKLTSLSLGINPTTARLSTACFWTLLVEL